MAKWNLTDLTGLYFVLMLLLLIAGTVLHICKRRAEKREHTQAAQRLRGIAKICLTAAGACCCLYLFAFLGSVSEYFAKGH